MVSKKQKAWLSGSAPPHFHSPSHQNSLAEDTMKAVKARNAMPKPKAKVKVQKVGLGGHRGN